MGREVGQARCRTPADRSEAGRGAARSGTAASPTACEGHTAVARALAALRTAAGAGRRAAGRTGRGEPSAVRGRHPRAAVHGVQTPMAVAGHQAGRSRPLVAEAQVGRRSSAEAVPGGRRAGQGGAQAAAAVAPARVLVGCSPVPAPRRPSTLAGGPRALVGRRRCLLLRCWWHRRQRWHSHWFRHLPSQLRLAVGPRLLGQVEGCCLLHPVDCCLEVPSVEGCHPEGSL
mmetsp:Transcript_34380/g.95052  ORF Transcript_34380/g.95052 Transcript_34380/m.95052 type:complete len:230 (+) Transcript_34380:525-1214(+)